VGNDSPGAVLRVDTRSRVARLSTIPPFSMVHGSGSKRVTILMGAGQRSSGALDRESRLAPHLPVSPHDALCPDGFHRAAVFCPELGDRSGHRSRICLESARSEVSWDLFSKTGIGALYTGQLKAATYWLTPSSRLGDGWPRQTPASSSDPAAVRWPCRSR
jgi:hypothetical protein